MTERTYSQEEIAALLERAAELQTDQPRTNKTGLTLTEIESVAQEAGIDPQLVRQAASEMVRAPQSKHLKSKDRSSTHVVVERIVPGTMPVHIWEDIVMELKHRYDSDAGKMMGMPEYGKSTTEKIGRSVEWKHTNMSGYETRLLVRPRAEKLHMRLTHRVGWATPLVESSTYGSVIALFAGILTGAIAHLPLLGFMVGLLTLLAIIPLLRWATNSWRDKKQNELEALADHVSMLVEAPEPVKPDVKTEQSETLQARLDEGLLEVEPSDSERSASQSSRLRQKQ